MLLPAPFFIILSPFIAGPPGTPPTPNKRIIDIVHKLKSCPRNCLLHLHQIQNELPAELDKLTTTLQKASSAVINLNPRQLSVENTEKAAKLLSHGLSLTRKFRGERASGAAYKRVGRVKRLLVVGVSAAEALTKALTTEEMEENNETLQVTGQEQLSFQKTNDDTRQAISELLWTTRKEVEEKQKTLLNSTKNSTKLQGIKKPLKSILKSTKKLTSAGVSSLMGNLVSINAILRPNVQTDDLIRCLDSSFKTVKYDFSKSMYTVASQLSKSSLTVTTATADEKQTSHQVLTDGSVRFTLFPGRLTKVLEERKKNGQSMIFANTLDKGKCDNPTCFIKKGRLTSLVQNKEIVSTAAKRFAEKIKQSLHDHSVPTKSTGCDVYRVTLDIDCGSSTKHRTDHDLHELKCAYI